MNRLLLLLFLLLATAAQAQPRHTVATKTFEDFPGQAYAVDIRDNCQILTSTTIPATATIDGADDPHCTEWLLANGVTFQVDGTLINMVIRLDNTSRYICNGTCPAQAYYKHLRLLTFPDCTQNPPNLKRISTVADFADINNPAFDIFCVEPGDYAALGNIEFTQSGTAGNERWILYYDPAAPADQTHPYHMADAKRAKFNDEWLFNSNYWVVDRLYFSPERVIMQVAQGIVLNRIYARDTDESGQVHFFQTASIGNRLQESVIGPTTAVPTKDRNCVTLNGGGDNWIIGNELVDCKGDGIASIAGNPNAGPSYIADNDIYLTIASYATSGGAPDPDPNAVYACAENALDLNSPDATQTHPQATEAGWHLVIERNRMWGFRQAATSCGGDGGGGFTVTWSPGNPNDTNFFVFRHNIFGESQGGIVQFSALSDAFNSSIISNLFYDMSYRPAGLGGDTLKLGAPTEINNEYYFNTIVGSLSSLAFGPAATNDIRCNAIINTPLGAGTPAGSTDITNNAWYNSQAIQQNGTLDITFATAAESNNADFVYTRKRLTVPENKTVPFGKTTGTSPHAAFCDSATGDRLGIGVDNTNVSSGFWGVTWLTTDGVNF